MLNTQEDSCIFKFVSNLNFFLGTEHDRQIYANINPSQFGFQLGVRVLLILPVSTVPDFSAAELRRRFVGGAESRSIHESVSIREKQLAPLLPAIFSEIS